MFRSIRRHTQLLVALPIPLTLLIACSNANSESASEGAAKGGAATSDSTEQGDTYFATGGRASSRTSSKTTSAAAKDDGSAGGSANSSQKDGPSGGANEAALGGTSGGSSASSKRTASSAGGSASGSKSSSGNGNGGTRAKTSAATSGGTKASNAVASGGTGTRTSTAATGGTKASGAPASGGSKPIGGSGGGSASNGSSPDAKTLLAKMRVGWNLGNSLDAVGGETKWGNPTVTPELIQAVADAGFGAVRIPVTWATHFGASPSYTIDEAWMKRVEEVVGYVLDRNLYAIINVHHDGAENGDGEWISILDDSGSVTESHNAAVRTQFVAIWKQIATRFKDKGERLLFESMNEIHVGYAEPPQAHQDVINKLNQTFVDTVRGTGGNNATRCLIVPGYNTNIDYTLKGFVKPTDSVTNKLILSVHYYDPWNYAGAGSTHVWGNAAQGHDDGGQEDYVTAQFDKLKSKFVDANLPVLMGEYGAVNQTGYENYRRYYVEYVTKAAHDRGILPVIWDNGGTGTGADAFGLFSRTNNAILHKDVVDAIIRAATSDYTLAQVAAP
ncbi:MAG TPA: glycoside hydrolase family 5 protein [Polyangiaceae bacterium]|nr:glycoside hydrolase family 5 protein [Polyangiaceae bacterium]